MRFSRELLSVDGRGNTGRGRPRPGRRPLAPVGNDHQRGDAGTGHAPGAAVVRLGVSPGAVLFILAILPILLGQLPRPLVGHNADALGLVECQQGELAVRVVAGGAAQVGITPRPFVQPLDGLDLLQPFHVVEDQLAVSFRHGPGKDHRLQRDDVGFVGLDRAEVVERLLYPLVVRLHAGVQKGQSTQRSNSTRHGHVGPGAVVALLLQQVGRATVDCLVDLLGGDFRPHRLYNRPKQPSYKGRSGKQALHAGIPPTRGKGNAGNSIISILELAS